MHALIVVAHPRRDSLTHQLALAIGQGVSSGNPSNTFEIADLAAEGFDPRFSAADTAVHDTRARPPADVLAEQARIDSADALVLVYPIYWWSMPALLKGWIDRVFCNGWAYEYSAEQGLVKKSQRLKVHLVGVGGADEGTYVRHGYFDAMKTQIDHGIFDFCGAQVVNSCFMLDSQSKDPAVRLENHLEHALALGRKLFSPASRNEGNPALTA